MASTTFENKLNAAIEEKGYRISARMGLEDRLARYIELTWIDRGEPLTKDEVDAVVALTMVNNFGDAAESQPRRSTRSAEGSDRSWDASESQPRRSSRLASRESVNYAEEDESEDTWQPRRSTRLAGTTRLANHTVTPSESLRVSFTTGSHSMVRRSQVTRR